MFRLIHKNNRIFKFFLKIFLSASIPIVFVTSAFFAPPELSFFYPKLYAHPIDISSIDIFINEDMDFKSIPDKELIAHLGINWVQAGTLLETQTTEETLIPELNKNLKTIENYFSQNLLFYNNGKECQSEITDIPEKPSEDLLIEGVSVFFRVSCEESLSSLLIDNGVFTDRAPLQQNYISVYKFPGDLIKGGLLKPGNTSFDVLVGEGLKTNFDSQTSYDAGLSSNKENSLIYKIPDLLKNLTPGATALIILVAIVIGALHALEGGHSKIILTSLVISNKVNMKKAFTYVVVFTLTHMSDIIIVGIAFLLVNSIADIYQKMAGLQLFSIYATLFLAGTMMLRETSNLARKHIIPIIRSGYKKKRADYSAFHEHDHQHGHEHTHDHHNPHDHHHMELDPKLTTRDQLLIAFLEGLAPCLTGWTILMLIISSGQIWLVIPVTLSFGIGIFIVLATLVLTVNKFKDLVSDRIEWFGEISPMISAVLLFATAVFFALN